MKKEMIHETKDAEEAKIPKNLLKLLMSIRDYIRRFMLYKYFKREMVSIICRGRQEKSQILTRKRWKT